MPPARPGAVRASDRLGRAQPLPQVGLQALVLALAALARPAAAVQLPANAVNVSSGETCPEGTTQPTVDWCQWYAGELGVYYLDKSGFYPEEGALVACGALSGEGRGACEGGEGDTGAGGGRTRAPSCLPLLPALQRR